MCVCVHIYMVFMMILNDNKNDLDGYEGSNDDDHFS